MRYYKFGKVFIETGQLYWFISVLVSYALASAIYLMTQTTENVRQMYLATGFITAPENIRWFLENESVLMILSIGSWCLFALLTIVFTWITIMELITRFENNMLKIGLLEVKEPQVKTIYVDQSYEREKDKLEILPVW